MARINRRMQFGLDFREAGQSERSPSPEREIGQLDLELEKMELDGAMPMANQAKRLLASLDFEWECEAASRKLLALSEFDAARKKVLREGGLDKIGAHVFSSCCEALQRGRELGEALQHQRNKSKTAGSTAMRPECVLSLKLLERALLATRLAAMYSLDSKEDLQWPNDLAQLLQPPLEASLGLNGMPPSMVQEAYMMLTVCLAVASNFSGSNLNAVFAAAIAAKGNMPLLLQHARRLQSRNLRGLSKHVAEKSLLMLCICASEQPVVCTHQISLTALASFCVATAQRAEGSCREICALLLARLVFQLNMLPKKYAAKDLVVAMLQCMLCTYIHKYCQL